MGSLGYSVAKSRKSLLVSRPRMRIVMLLSHSFRFMRLEIGSFLYAFLLSRIAQFPDATLFIHRRRNIYVPISTNCVARWAVF